MWAELNFEDAMNIILARLEEMELVVIDNTSYENVAVEMGKTGVIVSYLPKKACILCIELFQTHTRFHVTFSLCGQLVDRGYPIAKLGIEKHDYFMQTESNDGDFSIQFRLDRFETLANQISLGMEFFQKIFDRNLQLFAPRFKKIPFLHVLPTQTQKYQDTVNGLIETDFFDEYVKSMVPKFPAEIMPVNYLIAALPMAQ
jgi:hypothetical protein